MAIKEVLDYMEYVPHDLLRDANVLESLIGRDQGCGYGQKKLSPWYC